MSPIYDFVCPKCGKSEEDVSAKDGLDRICYECGFKMKKRVSAPTPVFRGDGWTPRYHQTGGVKHDD
jgi:putative FmdB family regulatory protein